MFSFTNAYPDIFSSGDLRRTSLFGGYTLENNGNPVCYIYQNIVNISLMPLYRFRLSSSETNNVYHTTDTQSQTISPPKWSGSGK